MKKILLLVAIFFMTMLSAKADLMPYYTSSIPSSTMGVYQAPFDFKIYASPNENSKVLLNISWSSKIYNCPQVSAGNLFLVFAQQKELAFLTVVDETEDWVLVIYDKSSGKTGWIKKDDPFRFSPWRNFFNMYGKKYGLYIFKDVSEDDKVLHSAAEEGSQLLNRLNLPQKIKLVTIKGNWALVSVMDMDKMPKTGYLKWRNTAGQIFVFPAIK